jgi:hypothetical protein
MDTRKPAKYLNVIKSQLETVYSCSISVSGTPLKVFSYIQIKEEENPQQFKKKKKKKKNQEKMKIFYPKEFTPCTHSNGLCDVCRRS